MNDMPASLLSPFRLGDLTLPNRVVMAPLTRNRANHETNAATDLIAEYYRQRASAGLIISEASQISQQGQGYIWTPGIYTKEQIAGWRKTTDAVHGAGGRIFIQLWHVGRDFACRAAAGRTSACVVLRHSREGENHARGRIRGRVAAARAEDG